MQRGLIVCVVGAALLVGAAARAYGQTTVYHLHKELSAINSANKQLKTIGPEPGVPQTAFQTINLKNSIANSPFLIANFETQSGVPGRAGTIAPLSTVSLTLLMKITALPNQGSNIKPNATIRLNSATGPYLCDAGGPYTTVSALTTTLAAYTFSCTTGTSAISMTASDRFFVTVNAWLAGSAGNHNLFGELDVETNADSTVTLPNPAPSITSLSLTSGFVGQSVTVTGTAFGATQGSSTVKFNGTTATITSWGDTSIAASVPAAATTGPVVVTVINTPSNGVTFTVVPHITSITPSAAAQG
jgi:IPT/TIG domain